MKAAVWHGYKDVRIEEVAEPTPKKGQVKIAVDWAGICGTDRHEYEGPNFIPVKKPHRLTGRVAPLIIGHEFSGRIVELGEDVDGWKVGDRVTANGSLTCGKCEACRSGRYNICQKLGFLGVGDDGAFADYVVVEAAKLFRIPEGVSQREAAVAEPLACGIHATNLMGDMNGKDVVVIGPGIIGLSAFPVFRYLWREARLLIRSLRKRSAMRLEKKHVHLAEIFLPESASTFRTIRDGAEARRLMVKSLLQSDRWAQRLYAEYRMRTSWRA